VLVTSPNGEVSNVRPSVAVRENADRIRTIIARYPVRNARIFGSAARGDDREGSDLDLLVEPMDETTLYDLAGLKLELEALLGVGVDIATPRALRAGCWEDCDDLRPL
jgi:predicted nucleotidyltransferase